VHSGFLILVVLILAPLASAIPLCCLSAILFVVSWNMSELPQALRLVRKAPKPDAAILVVTFLLTVFVDLVVAVNVGVIVAALMFMRRSAEAVQIEEEPADATSEAGATSTAGNGVVIYSIQGPFFFGAAEKLERTLAQTQRRAHTLILRMGHVPFVDATGILAIEEIISDFRRQGVAVLLAELRPNVRYKLERAGVLEHLGIENLADSLEQAHAIVERRRNL
jgi:SulP family sulfate permease